MPSPFTTFISDWWALAVLASAGSVLISIILILLSRAFDLRNLEQTAKTEFVFAASTVLIVLFTYGLISVAEGTPESPGVVITLAKEMYLNAVTYCPPSASAVPGSVCDKLSQLKESGVIGLHVNTTADLMLLYMEPPAKCSQEFLDFLYYASIPIEACASLYMEIFMSEQLTCFGLKWVAERITNTTQLLTFYMFVYYLIFHTMNFIKYYAGFFFSVGVILRAFPPTRGGGAYLMALTVGLYFVFPFAYILVSSTSMPYAQASTFSAKDVTSEGVVYTCGIPAISKDVDALQCGTGSVYKPFELLSWLKTNREKMNSFFTINIPGLMKHLVAVICIFPMVAFVILMTFVLNTTNLFGGNIPEIGRGLVRLI